MECVKVIEKLEELSPSAFALDWDNTGLLVGRTDKDTKRVLLTVDVTQATVDEAVELGVDMIISHHPLIFSKLNAIRADHFVGKRIYKLIQNDIACFAMHTNFDVMGMADAAADELNLLNTEVLEVTYEDEISKEGIGRIGHLSKKRSLQECAILVKEAFSLENVKVFGDLSVQMERIAISTGSGKSMIKPAIEKKCDVLITGDIDYHTALDALAQGLCLIDAGHFGLEKMFIPYVREYLNRELPEIEVYASHQKEIGIVL